MGGLMIPLMMDVARRVQWTWLARAGRNGFVGGKRAVTNGITDLPTQGHG